MATVFLVSCGLHARARRQLTSWYAWNRLMSELSYSIPDSNVLMSLVKVRGA